MGAAVRIWQGLMIKTNELYWVAGIVEGEGTVGFYKTPQVRVPQKDPEILYRLMQLLGGKVYGPYLRGQSPKVTTIYQWRLLGAEAVGLAMTLFPLLSKGRQRQILSVLRQWHATQSRIATIFQKLANVCRNGHLRTDANTRVAQTPHGRQVTCRRCAVQISRRHRLKLMAHQPFFTKEVAS